MFFIFLFSLSYIEYLFKASAVELVVFAHASFAAFYEAYSLLMLLSMKPIVVQGICSALVDIMLLFRLMKGCNRMLVLVQ